MPLSPLLLCVQGFKGPIFAKTDVNGSNAEPLWTYLKSKQGGMLTSDVKWNFTKVCVWCACPACLPAGLWPG